MIDIIPEIIHRAGGQAALARLMGGSPVRSSEGFIVKTQIKKPTGMGFFLLRNNSKSTI